MITKKYSCITWTVNNKCTHLLQYQYTHCLYLYIIHLTFVTEGSDDFLGKSVMLLCNCIASAPMSLMAEVASLASADLSDISPVLSVSISSNYHVTFSLLLHLFSVSASLRHVLQFKQCLRFCGLTAANEPNLSYTQYILCLPSRSVNLSTLRLRHVWNHASITIFLSASEANPGNGLLVLYTSLGFSHLPVAR